MGLKNRVDHNFYMADTWVLSFSCSSNGDSISYLVISLSYYNSIPDTSHHQKYQVNLPIGD